MVGLCCLVGTKKEPSWRCERLSRRRMIEGVTFGELEGEVDGEKMRERFCHG